MFKYLILLLLSYSFTYGQHIGIREARIIDNMNVGVQYLIVNNDYVVSGFNVEKFYQDGGIISLSVSNVDQNELINKKIVKIPPYVVYKTPDNEIYFDYNVYDFKKFIQDKGYSEKELNHIDLLLKWLLEW